MKIKTFCLAVISTLMAWNIHAGDAYARLSSLKTQLPEAPKSLVLMDSADEMKNIEISASRDKLIVKEAGIYYISSSGQIGAVAPGAKGYLDMWFEKNGKPVVNSTARMTLPSSVITAPFTDEIVIELQAGDTISTAFSASGPSVGFIFIQPENAPACASFLISMFKISN